MPLYVSSDASLERLELSNGRKDEHGIVHVPARLKIPESHFGDFGGLVRQEDLGPDLGKLGFSTASGKARLANDVEAIGQPELKTNGETGTSLLIPATLRFWQGQDRMGEPVENPLPPWISKWMREGRISMGRLFALTPGTEHLTGDQVRRARDRIQYHKDAQVLKDGRILLPASRVQFPIRFDANVLRKGALHEAYTVGRGAIDTVQPPIKLGLPEIPPHSYRVTATQFSILSGLRAIIDSVVVDRVTHEPTSVRHGTSVMWDGGRTTGLAPEHLRQLELENIGDKPVDMNRLAVAVRVYETKESSLSLPRIAYSLPSSEVHEKGVTVGSYLAARPHSDALRTAFSRLEGIDDAFGMVVSSKGAQLIYAESTPEFQDQAVLAASEAAAHEDFQPTEQWPELGEFQDFLGQVSDYRQRSILLTREAPSADVLGDVMKLGLRGVCTPNVAGNLDQIYLDEALLQQYSVLMKKGFGLYLLTPENVRMLWHQLFVKVGSLERLAKADFRIGGYAASAAGAETVMMHGKLEEALARIKHDFPNAAMVTGASESGGMGYLNRAAEQAGMVTIGVANKIPGQEKANDSYDGVMYHGRSEFVTRQGHISRMVSMPLVSIGAEGSDFEQSLHRVLIKIGLGALAPISYVDPMGMAEGQEHMYESPITKLQKTFTTMHYRTKDPFTLSRSPYVGSLLHFTDSYLDAYERAKPFFDDPIRYLKNRGVPSETIRLAIDSMCQDAEFTGLPMHAFWQKAIKGSGGVI